MRDAEIDALSKDEVLELMRRENLPVVHSLFATIHRQSEVRPNGFSDDDLDEISDTLQDHDLVSWKKQLKAHFSSV